MMKSTGSHNGIPQYDLLSFSRIPWLKKMYEQTGETLYLSAKVEKINGWGMK